MEIQDAKTLYVSRSLLAVATSNKRCFMVLGPRHGSVLLVFLRRKGCPSSATPTAPSVAPPASASASLERHCFLLAFAINAHTRLINPPPFKVNKVNKVWVQTTSLNIDDDLMMDDEMRIWT